MEANDGSVNDNEGIASFNELVKEMVLKQDLKAFAFKTKAMLLQMEHKVQRAKQQESVYWHLASHGVPQSLHCLCLKLAEEYAVNAIARSSLPPPEFASRLSDPTLHHLVLLTDNVLAASVVVTSTVENSANPEKLVFHVVTDKKTYASMHAWFATNSIQSAIVEVRGLHQYDWSEEMNSGVKEMLETNHLIWKHYYDKEKNIDYSNLNALRPSSLSLMNQLRIYIPECGWLYGMNVFDLDAWRRTNITETYRKWLKLNLESGTALWNPGVLSPALIAFDGQVHPIDPSMIVTDLGYRYRSEEISKESLEAASVIHFSGPAKPWLEIGFPEYRRLWSRYVNSSNKFIRRCRIIR
ncbi:hypothetical protein KIW84_055132 [Lathyrus oleraceus]|uniref:Hexosyltransferase n=2 Tax=Pisum sativum TaxID=3888 RepID=A0A9D4WV07_PEA|nr:hypothetical protein KIW84_055132 [Pisum sativum]